MPSLAKIGGNSGTPVVVGRFNNQGSNGCGSMSAYIAGARTILAHPLTVDCGCVIRLSARAKWLQRALRLKKLGRFPRLGGIATKVLMDSYIMTLSILVCRGSN